MKTADDARYRIRPLAWTRTASGLQTATTILGMLGIHRDADGTVTWWHRLSANAEVVRAYCSSLDEARRKAEAFYRDQLRPALVLHTERKPHARKAGGAEKRRTTRKS